MSPSRARYVTACQQLLALGVVVMALVPATRVVSLDVVGVGPGQGVAKPSITVSPDASLDGSASAPAAGSTEADRSGYARGQQRCAPRSLRVAERGGPTRLTGRACLAGVRHPSPTRPAGAG